jgi:hypothetical protein
MNEDTPAPTTSTSQPTMLNLQNGMPVIVQSRSKELIYDALEDNQRFIMNPYGLQILPLVRTNYRWN